LPENGNEHTPEAVSDEALKQLETLAADAELAAVVDSWGRLPESLRNGILAMVRGAIGEP